MADYNITEAFEAIENELIDSMMRNFSRHRAEENEEGYLWSQWQAEQLKSLEQYRKGNTKKFSKKFSEINGKVAEMLKTARADGNAEQEAEILQMIRDGLKLSNPPASSSARFFAVNERKLNALIKATTDDLKKAESAVLRQSNDLYRKAIFNAQVYANTGAGTYEKAVDMACRDMLRAGLNCVEYKNGARHTLSDYSSMAIRTANKRAHLMGEGEKRAEWRITTVIVNQRHGACALCAPYVGKVFIDDVYSGGKKSDGKYPLLSEAIKDGLFHPNCKDGVSTYIEGITDIEPVTPEEQAKTEQLEKLEARKSHCENEAEKNRRIAKYSLDDDNKRIYEHRADVFEGKAKQTASEIASFTAETVENFNKEHSENTPIDVLSEYIKSSTPKNGRIVYDKNYNLDLHKNENDFAKILLETFGGNIQLLQEINEDKVLTPDYLWNGRLWDLKNVTTEKAANSAIRKALKQIEGNPGGVILNYGDIDLSLEELEKVIMKRMNWHRDKNIDIMIFAKGKVVKILRFIAKK